MYAINFFEKILVDEKVVTDSIRYQFYMLGEGLTFQINEGPYVGLKSTGLDKITNDSLRSRLMYLYDFAVPRYEDLIEWNETRFTNRTTEIQGTMTSNHEYRMMVE